ncbi:MAG: hypothetical protein AAF564_21790 [Bacteroidota bacterium]
MMSISQIILATHITAGVISLVLFWAPLLTTKGRTLHIRFGRAYTYTMYIVVISALILSVVRFSIGGYQAGLALFFLGILTAIPLLSGIQVLKAKKSNTAFRKLQLALAITLLITSLGMFAGWWYLNSGLLLGFGFLGLFAGGADVRQFLRSTKTNWLREHYQGMLFSGAAAYTAFFAFGGNTLLSHVLTGWLAIIPWLLPTLLTMALMPLVHKRFKQVKRAEQPKAA